MRPDALNGSETASAQVAVTGVGLVTPIGHDWETFRRRLWEGRSGVSEIDRFDVTYSPVRAGGQVRDFHLKDFLGSARAREIDRTDDPRTSFACAAVAAAVEDAKVADHYEPERIGACLGAGIMSYSVEVLDVVARVLASGHRGDAFLDHMARTLAADHLDVEQLVADRVVAQTCRRAGVRGPFRAELTTCAASLVAMAWGLAQLRRGSLDACLVGGSDSLLQPYGLAMFERLGALSSREGPPWEMQRPFDRDRDGIVLGEGAAVLVLERLESALERGAGVLAVIRGVGGSMDAFNVTAPHPEGRGAIDAMRRALHDAGVAPETVDYINAHGTATELNDPMEVAAIKKVFGPRAREIPVSSSKPMFGHLLAACGAIESLVTIAALCDQMVPPTLNLTIPDPDCDLDHVPNTARPGALKTALSNAFGFGGYNASVVIETASA